MARGTRIARGCRAGLAAFAFASTPVAQAADAGVQTHTIVIEAMRFNPETLTLRRGDRVVWHNKDLVPHTATARGVFDSRSIAAQGSWTYVTRKAGTLAYVCSFHPTMKGTLSVR